MQSRCPDEPLSSLLSESSFPSIANIGTSLDAASAVPGNHLLCHVPHKSSTATLELGSIMCGPTKHQQVPPPGANLRCDAETRTSAVALQQLGQDPRFLGGQLGMVGVL